MVEHAVQHNLHAALVRFFHHLGKQLVGSLQICLVAYNVDGWRLDVAADLGFSPEFNHHFWQEFRS